MVSISFQQLDHHKPQSLPIGYERYIEGVKYQLPESIATDGYLSLCIDARLPVTKIFERFKTKIPVSSAGNAVPKPIKNKFSSKDKNVVVTHGMVHQESDKHLIPQCGGHQLVTQKNNSGPEFEEISVDLKPTMSFNETGYDYHETTKNIGQNWNTDQCWFYDHSDGWLYDATENQSPMYLGVAPSLFFSGLPPKEGQDPSLIIINTTSIPYFYFSKGIKGKKIGGVVEILYPEPQLPEIIIQSLIFCVKNHFENKKTGTHFASSDLILFVAKQKRDIPIMIDSILNSKHLVNRDYFLSFNKDPNDIILGLLPLEKEPLYELKF